MRRASNPWLDVLTLINGFQITQAIHFASTLRIADFLKDAPRSSDELASLTKTTAARFIARGILRELFAESGFELTRVAPAGNVNVIEARPR